MYLIIGIDCPSCLLLLEFPQTLMEMLHAAKGAELGNDVSSWAGSYAREVARTHLFPLMMKILSRNPSKGILSSPQTCNLGATLVTGRRGDEGCFRCAEVFAGHIIQLIFN